MKRFLLPILTGVAAVAAHAQESDSVRMYRLQQIEVTATRATPRTPVAYTDLSHDAIARNSYGTDIPTVLSLDAYCVTNLNLSYSFRTRNARRIRLGLQVNNLFNAEYENNGYGYSTWFRDSPSQHTALYFPQAPLNVLANVTVKF